jgi:uncharacterized protein involved in oxidation of intracellular sulfur
MLKSKKIFLLLILICLSANTVNAQSSGNYSDTKTKQTNKPSKIGIIISSNDPETVWNAFRLANYSVQEGDTVSIFLIGKGVETPTMSSKDYDVKGLMEKFYDAGGKILACGTCLKSRNNEGSKLCPVSSLSDLYKIVKTNEIILTF